MKLVSEAEEVLASLGVRLKPVSDSLIDGLKAEFGTLPEAYVDLLTKIGAGGIGGKLQIYDGLLDPHEIYDADTAERLRGVVLFGDDCQGNRAGFVPDEDWRVVEIDPTSGEPAPAADDFEQFMLHRLAKVGG